MTTSTRRGRDLREPWPLARLDAALGDAPLAATRKITHKGWLPRSRQVGVTGRSLAPDPLCRDRRERSLQPRRRIHGGQTVLALNIDLEPTSSNSVASVSRGHIAAVDTGQRLGYQVLRRLWSTGWLPLEPISGLLWRKDGGGRPILGFGDFTGRSATWLPVR